MMSQMNKMMNHTTSVKISGSGMAIPAHVVDNSLLENTMDTTSAFIDERTGIITRRYVSNNQNNSDLMLEAINKAVSNAGLKNRDIDMMIVNTLSPDYHDPSQACLLQGMIDDMGKIPVFDIRAQCSGFLYALYLSEKLILSNAANHVLVVCGEVLSRRIKGSIDDRNIAVLLGDGAGCAVVSKSTGNTGFIDINIGADGRYFDTLVTKSPGTRDDAFVSGSTEAGDFLFNMQGKALAEHAIETITAEALSMMKKHRLDTSDITKFVTHQPNVRMLESIAGKLNVDTQKMIVNADKYGNMASASLAVAWGERQKNSKKGDLSLLIGYGAGATWGSALYLH